MIKNYNYNDYKAYETLVSNAWKFDQHFQPEKFVTLIKYLYAWLPLMSLILDA